MDINPNGLMFAGVTSPSMHEICSILLLFLMHFLAGGYRFWEESGYFEQTAVDFVLLKRAGLDYVFNSLSCG